MPEVKLHVTLIAHTPEPEKIIAMASRTCYSALDLDGLRDKAETADNAAYIRRVLASGHASVVEHASFTFASRAFRARSLRRSRATAWPASPCRASATFRSRARRYLTMCAPRASAASAPRRRRGISRR